MCTLPVLYLFSRLSLKLLAYLLEHQKCEVVVIPWGRLILVIANFELLQLRLQVEQLVLCKQAPVRVSQRILEAGRDE